MKIAFLSFYSGAIDRGVETSTAALAAGLSKKHDVTLFQSGSRIVHGIKTVRISVDNRWPQDSSSSPLRRLYLDYYSRKITIFTLKFLSYLFREKYDVVIPTNGGWQVVLCRIATWFLRKKMIVQGNAGIGRDDLWSLLCFPNHYIAISPEGLKWAQEKMPAVTSSYIPHGVNVSLFRHFKAAKVNLKKPIVLCVAAFLPYKQIDLLIKAMEQVTQASLLVIGHGPEEQKLSALGKQLLGDRFLLKIGIRHDMLPGFYKEADVFSLPSKSSEAQGIVYIEALAAGLPVVAPDDINRRSIIGSSGVFVDPTNEKEYAEGIRKALRKNFGNLPYKQAQKFKWEHIIKQYEELFNNL